MVASSTGPAIAPALSGRCRLLKLRGHTKAAMEPGWNLVADLTKILRKTHLGSKDVTVAIKTLVESGEVKVCERKREGADRPVTFILKTSS